MVDIRGKAKEILAAVPETGEITSNGNTKKKFAELTGTSHETLAKNWAGGGIMTACNGFTGWYAKTLRGAVDGTRAPSDYLGRFDLNTYLPKIGMGHAWVKSTADRRPQYGDICRHTAFHVSVSLHFDGDYWNRAEAGQGGPKRGCDVLKRNRSKTRYDFTKVMGWVDIELYYDTSPKAGPEPGWLIGWWTVRWRSQDYYYYFDGDNEVHYTQIRPQVLKKPPVAEDIGAFAVDGSTVSIRWPSGALEVLKKTPAAGQMKGTYAGTEPISAKKL